MDVSTEALDDKFLRMFPSTEDALETTDAVESTDLTTLMLADDAEA